MPGILVPLSTLAIARSGDKGTHVNIGIIARDPDDYDFLQKCLTEDRVRKHFSHLPVKKVLRYELKNIHAFNFILTDVLQGGGSLSPSIDSQGKTFAQALLLMPIEISEKTEKNAPNSPR